MKRLALIVIAVLAAVAAPAAGAAIQVGITSPPDGAHSLSGIVPVRVAASADYGVYGVQLYVDGQPYSVVQTAQIEPYQYEIMWDTSTVSPGSHTLAADAIDWSQIGGGSHELSTPITVDVGPDYPTVSLVGPPSWTFVRGTIELSANVTAVGSTSLEYSVDGASVATLTGAPWTASFDTTTVPDGWRNVTATVTDGRGEQATAAATVTVDNTAPSVYLTSPAAERLGDRNARRSRRRPPTPTGSRASSSSSTACRRAAACPSRTSERRTPTRRRSTSRRSRRGRRTR